MQIKGAIALVTGGAKGIGFAFSLALLEHGAKAVSHLLVYFDYTSTLFIYVCVCIKIQMLAL